MYSQFKSYIGKSTSDKKQKKTQSNTDKAKKVVVAQAKALTGDVKGAKDTLSDIDT